MVMDSEQKFIEESRYEIDDWLIFRNEKPDGRREFMWRINYPEDGIGEQSLDVDHPGSWEELQENTILS